MSTALAGRFFTIWATREANICVCVCVCVCVWVCMSFYNYTNVHYAPIMTQYGSYCKWSQMMATDDTKMWLQGRGRNYASELVACTRPYMIQTITQALINSLESLPFLLYQLKVGWAFYLLFSRRFSFFDEWVLCGRWLREPPAW